MFIKTEELSENVDGLYPVISHLGGGWQEVGSRVAVETIEKGGTVVLLEYHRNYHQKIVFSYGVKFANSPMPMGSQRFVDALGKFYNAWNFTNNINEGCLYFQHLPE